MTQITGGAAQAAAEPNQNAIDGSSLSVVELIRRQARVLTRATALVERDKRVSYSELEERSNSLAQLLRASGVGPEVFVGIGMPRSIDAVVAILAVLQAGGAYVPLDPAFPAAWTQHVIADAGLSYLVTNSDFASRFDARDARLILMDGLPGASLSRDFSARQRASAPGDAAYVSYTSGSTGTPKGVVYTYSHLLQYLPAFQEDDICSLGVSLAFSFSLPRLFPPLIAGLRTVILHDDQTRDSTEFSKIIERERITNLSMVPTALRQLIEANPAPSRRLASLRLVTIAGAALPRDLIEGFRKVAPSASLYYGYGSSETGPATLRNVYDDTDPRNIGWPLPGVSVYILDSEMRPVPAGETADLFIGGRQLAREYLNLPELSAQRFLPDPFRPSPEYRIFRAMERARFLPDGQVELFGREDNQVKIRGFRVQLEQVEVVLALHRNVLEATVTAFTFDGENRLAAYLICSGENRPCISELRDHLLGHLPEYMVPASFMIVDRFPLTPSGKINRQALPPPLTQRSDLDSPYEAPRNAAETVLVRIWSDVLGVPGVGIRDHFLDLGGDSLAATRIIARVWEELGVDVSLMQILDKPTIAELASEIEVPFGPPLDDIPQTINPGSRKTTE